MSIRILFINLPYIGHVLPTVGLVQELIKQGCRVTYLLPFGWEESVAESGAEFCGYQNHRQLSEQMRCAYALADSMAEQFDLILYEQFFFLGKHLAEKHGKPAVRVFTAPATNKKLMAEFIASGPMSVFRHKWLARTFTKDVARGIPLKTDNWLDEIVENPPELNLVYTLREYQPCAEDFPAGEFRFLGPSVYERAARGLDFTKGARPLVYISLGTVLRGVTSFFQSCVEAFRGEDVDVILSVGQRFDPRRLRNVPANVRVYRWVPQTEVLKMADVFVTHGGMNSVSEALCAAVPMVVIPFCSDQPVNARCVERLGVGRRLERAEVRADTLRRGVLAVAADEGIRANLARMRQRIREAPGNRGGAEMIMEYYRNRVAPRRIQ